MSVFVLTHTVTEAYHAKSEIIGVYADEALARGELGRRKSALLKGKDSDPWIAVDELEDGRVLAYGGKGGISFVPGYYRISEHEVLGV